jgi:hypothetical protein
LKKAASGRLFYVSSTCRPDQANEQSPPTKGRLVELIQGTEPMEGNAVTTWFGAHFTELHPLLQRLHREGAELTGEVEVRYGRGLAGLLGRRLARSLGLPADNQRCEMRVEIRHAAACLFWNRRFAGGQRMNSTFVPHGHFPDGYWLESTGMLSLELGVHIVDGGWHWQQRRMLFLGRPLPGWLLPRSNASKRIENGQYRFSVTFTLPWLGLLFSYAGNLQAEGS